MKKSSQITACYNLILLDFARWSRWSSLFPISAFLHKTHIFSPEPFLAFSTGKGFPPHKSNPWVVTSNQEADLGLLRCTKPKVNNGKSYQPQQVSRISEPSTSTNRKFGDWNNFNFSRLMLHLQDFPLKKTEISRFASGKNPISQDHHALLVHSFSSASTTHLEGMDGVYYILHLSLLSDSVGSFFSGQFPQN